MDYLVVNQTDFDIYFDWEESLAGYSAELHYYLESAGTSSSTSVTATVSTQTTSLTYVYYEVPANSPILDSEGTWVVHSEITSSSSRWRACEPVYIEVQKKGRR